MATQESMAIRCNAALDEIEDILSGVLGQDLESLPRAKQDREMLRVIQLEGIRDWLRLLPTEALETIPVKDARLMFETRMAELSNATVATKPKPRQTRQRRK
jgi:hypothetical protein